MATVVPVRLPEPEEEKLFRIGEVSRLTETKAFVLRYWEQEIPKLQPVKTPTGHRLYRREDIDTVLEIKRLLYEEGFTLAGARKHLSERRPGEPRPEPRPGPHSAPPRPEQRPERRPEQLSSEHRPQRPHEQRIIINRQPEARTPESPASTAQSPAPAVPRETEPPPEPDVPVRSTRAHIAHQKILLDLHEELLAILTLLKPE